MDPVDAKDANEVADEIRSATAEIRDVSTLARQIAILLKIQYSGGLEAAIVKQVLVGACWWVSNGHGRKLGCPRKSIEAINRIGEPPQWVEGLEHDHVVPRTLIVKRILAMVGPDPNPVQIEEVLRCSFECVVTRDEHVGMTRSTMPPNWNETDLWSRYRGKGIFPEDRFPEAPIGARFSPF